MCDRIIMHDGIEIGSIAFDGSCLCGRTQKEILIWIILQLPDLQIDETVEIKRDSFGYFIKIQEDAQGRVSKSTSPL